jgi:hypothetical protein
MIYSRDEFKDYCLRKLGAPVIQINVDDDQLEDRIDDALAKFWEFHGDGTERKFYIHVFTQGDIDNQFFNVDETVMSILKIYPQANQLADVNLQYQMFITDLMNPRNLNGGMHSYVITEQYLSTIDQFFNRERTFQFNRYTNEVRINTDWTQVKVGDSILFEANINLDPDAYSLMWNDQWLKAYGTALFKEQWGSNLSKYSGFQLPSGIVLNGDKILDEAKQEIVLLHQELMDQWSLPVDFMCG